MTETAAVLDALPKLNLAEIREALKAKETELEAVIAEHRKAIEALRQLERIVDTAQNGPKPKAVRKPREPRAPRLTPAPASPTKQLTVRQRAVIYLSANGATKFVTLAEELNCASNSLYKMAQDDPWFRKEGPCIALSDLGRRNAA